MGSIDKIVKTMKLNGTENGKITIATIKEPYGENSESIVSIGIFLDADSQSPNWIAHIPKSNIDDVAQALLDAKKEI